MKKKAATIFKDKNGRVVIWQSPNMLLWAWIILKAVAMFLAQGKIKAGLDQLSGAVLFAWAYFEADQGVSPFRKILGAIIMLGVAVGFFVQG